MANAFEEIAALAVQEWNAKPVRKPHLTGVFRQLAAEHAEVTQLLARVKGADGPLERQSEWRLLRVALLSHERAELQEIYPAFAHYPCLDIMVREHADQAHVLHRLVAELSSVPADVPPMPMDSSAWKTAFDRVEKEFSQHVAIEEGLYFPRGDHAMGTDRTTALELVYLSAKRNLEASI